MKLFCFILSLLFFSTLFSQQYYLLVGTYTDAGSEGIYVYDFNIQTGESKLVNKVASKNPSYLAPSQNGKYVYAVNENGGNEPGTVSAFAFNKSNGSLTFLNSKTTSGDHPCYITINKKSTHVIVGNYSGGNLAVFPVLKNGSLDNASQLITHMGKSVNKERQEKSHVHAVVFSPNEKQLYVPDLGIDKVLAYSFNPAQPKPLKELIGHHIAVPPGSGPRHFLFHPNRPFAYLIEELTGTVSSYRYQNGRLRFLQRTSSYSKDYKGVLSSADIHISPEGDNLYTSNRGNANDIGIFVIEPSIGTIRLKASHPSGGVKPRNFMIDPSGNFILVANQDSDNIVVFRRNKSTGLLDPTGQEIKVPNPVCLQMIRK